eukprot:6208388-Pleurochrysis_carterae.AAC.2
MSCRACTLPALDSKKRLGYAICHIISQTTSKFRSTWRAGTTGKSIALHGGGYLRNLRIMYGSIMVEPHSTIGCKRAVRRASERTPRP